MGKINIISVVNQKGGVGKTTTSVNLACALAVVGQRTLLLDFDPQGNASTGLGIAMTDRNENIYEVMVGNISIEDAIKNTEIKNLDIITATMDLAAAENDLIDLEEREFVISRLLKKIENNYDNIIIDCPPSLGLMTVNSLVASHSLIIPVQCEFFALEGLSHLLATIELVKKNLNKKLYIHGLVLTMHDKRIRLTEQVEKEVREYFGDLVYSTIIPRNIRLAEAPSHGKPSIIYDVNCSGSIAYLRLAKEVLARIKNNEKEMVTES